MNPVGWDVRSGTRLTRFVDATVDAAILLRACEHPLQTRSPQRPHRPDPERAWRDPRSARSQLSSKRLQSGMSADQRPNAPPDHSHSERDDPRTKDPQHQRHKRRHSSPRTRTRFVVRLALLAIPKAGGRLPPPSHVTQLNQAAMPTVCLHSVRQLCSQWLPQKHRLGGLIERSALARFSLPPRHGWGTQSALARSMRVALRSGGISRLASRSLSRTDFIVDTAAGSSMARLWRSSGSVVRLCSSQSGQRPERETGSAQHLGPRTSRPDGRSSG